MEIYPVNVNRLHRYASRRGVEKELSDYLMGVKQERVSMFSAVQKYLSNTAITKAWVFGFFSRGEETEQSDLDLLVEYDHSSQLSLLNVIRYKLDLEELIGRDVDLVENGYLLPFAVESARIFVGGRDEISPPAAAFSRALREQSNGRRGGNRHCFYLWANPYASELATG